MSRDLYFWHDGKLSKHKLCWGGDGDACEKVILKAILAQTMYLEKENPPNYSADKFTAYL